MFAKIIKMYSFRNCVFVENGIDHVVLEVGPSHAVLLSIRCTGNINVYTTEAVRYL